MDSVSIIYLPVYHLSMCHLCTYVYILSYVYKTVEQNRRPKCEYKQHTYTWEKKDNIFNRQCCSNGEEYHIEEYNCTNMDYLAKSQLQSQCEG